MRQELAPLLASAVLFWFLFGGARADVTVWPLGTPPTLDSFSHSLPPGTLLSRPSAAVPTSKFWTPLIFDDGRDMVAPLPYFVRSDQSAGLSVSYPTVDTTASQIYTLSEMDVTLSAVEGLAPNHRVTSYDEMSVWMRFDSADGYDSPKAITFPLVRGSPYITALYTRLTPMLNFSSPILNVSGLSVGESRAATRFVIQLANGQLWTLYSPQAGTLLFDTITTVRFTAPLTGVIRLAYVPSSAAQGVLDACYTAYPTACYIHHNVTGDVADLIYTFTVEGGLGANLLMLAQPHHVAALNVIPVLTGAYYSLKGELSGILGAEWHMTVSLPDLDWLPTGTAGVQDAIASALRASLAVDASNLTADAADPYTFGAEASRIANLALIANQLQENNTRDQCVQFLQEKISDFLANDSANALAYELSWGGVVPRNALMGQTLDAGDGWYIDHHIHYGPVLYAAAVVLLFDQNAWLNDSSASASLELLSRDYGNPSASADVYFPNARHKDWFEWHSWSDGIYNDPTTGRALSSVSESAHAYFALALYASVTGQSELATFARMLCGMELAAARAYWFPNASSTTDTVYQQPFTGNKMVSTLAQFSVTTSPLIESLAQHTRPLSVLTPLLTTPGVIADMWPYLSASVLSDLSPYSEVYRSYYSAVGAMIDNVTAIEDLSALAQFDATDSRTSILYWAATRPASSVVVPLTQPDLVSPATTSPTSTPFYLRVLFSGSSGSTSSSGSQVDTGVSYSHSRGFGWKGKTTFVSRTLPLTYSSDFNSLAVLSQDIEWVAALPVAGDYTLRMALAPAVEGETECNGASLVISDDVAMTVGTCASPLGLWTGTVTLQSSLLVLKGDNSCAIAVIEIFTAPGVHADIAFIKTNNDVTMTSSMLAAITGVPEDRFHVSSQSNTAAILLVLDAELTASSMTSNSIVAELQQVPASLWASYGFNITSIAVSNAQESGNGFTPDDDHSSSHHAVLSSAAIAIIVVISVAVTTAIILLVVWKKFGAKLSKQLQKHRSARKAESPSVPNSTLDLLRATSSANVITPPTSDVALQPREPEIYSVL